MKLCHEKWYSTPNSIDNFVNSQRIFASFCWQNLWKICDKTVI